MTDAPRHNGSNRAGYSLVEMAAVLGIIAIVVGISISVGSTQLQAGRLLATERTLQTVRDALLTYQKQYQRFPCPAPATNAAGSGAEAASCGPTASPCTPGVTCSGSAAIGMVPFTALGLGERSAYDAWDMRITYAVDRGHVAASLYGLGNLTIQDANAVAIAPPANNPANGGAIFVLVSHGEDKKGAYNGVGAVSLACGAAGEDDAENCDLNDAIFADAPINNGTVAANYFYDVVTWYAQQRVNPIGAVNSAATPEATASSANPGLDAGDATACAFAVSGGQADCWGEGSAGQIGDNDGTDKTSPSDVDGPPALSDAINISVGWLHSCAVKSDNTVACWGAGTDGRRGDGSTVQSNVPDVIAGFADVIQVSAGSQHSCAVKDDGTAYCWGDDASGQLGNDNAVSADQVSPVAVDRTQIDVALPDATDLFTQISAGQAHTCAVTYDATDEESYAWCWGNGQYGRLGNDGTANVLRPTTRVVDPAVVANPLSGVIYVSAGYEHSCAVDKYGSAWCWGRNNNNQLGDGGTATPGTDSDIPVRVKGNLTGASKISAGDDHTCALDDAGLAWCWGLNADGQLGDGTTTARTQPTFPVTTTTGVKYTDVVGVSAGSGFSCAVQKNGDFWCWGDDTAGRLGNGGGGGCTGDLLGVSAACPISGIP